MEDSQKPYGFLLNLLQPGAIVLSLLMFFVGLGVSHYLGGNIEWLNSLLISFSLLFLLWSRNLLMAYFDHPESPYCVLTSTHPRYVQLKGTKRVNLLTYALVSLTTWAALTFLVMARHVQDVTFVILLAIAVLAGFFSAVPPVHLQRRGYGEITESFIIVILVPAIGLVLNYGDIHPILLMLTFPVMLLYLAAKIVFIFPSYLADKAGGNANLLNRLDWERSMRLHNLLVGAAFLFVGIFSVTGLPWILVWPMLLPIPLGIFQITQMIWISNGAKPRWSLFKWTAGASVGLMAYLVLLTLWLN